MHAEKPVPEFVPFGGHKLALTDVSDTPSKTEERAESPDKTVLGTIGLGAAKLGAIGHSEENCRRQESNLTLGVGKSREIKHETASAKNVVPSFVPTASGPAPTPRSLPADLAAVVGAWDRLPQSIRKAIGVLVGHFQSLSMDSSSVS